MARSRPSPNKSRRAKGSLYTAPTKRRESNPNELLSQALTLLQIGDAQSALPLALRALALSNPNRNNDASATHGNTHQKARPAFLQALSLLAEINLELGNADAARSYFLKAVTLDPQGEISEEEGGGVEKFLWLAQLCKEGGEESVRWFQRGVEVLNREIAGLEAVEMKGEGAEEKKRKLVGALCGIVEVYMTDLSLDPNAEAHCTSNITTALSILPLSPQPHQTHASVLISQSKPEAARTALRTCLSLWRALPTSHPDVPDFPARISLVRLLLEVGMEEDALEVVGGCVESDDTCVEGWYLGGWGLYILGEKRQSGDAATKERPEKKGEESEEKDDWTQCWRGSIQWLRTCLNLYEQLDYEDERLREHARELVFGIESEFREKGIELDVDEDEAEGDEWTESDENEVDDDGAEKDLDGDEVMN